MKKQVTVILALVFLLGTACIKDHHKPTTEVTVSTFAGSGQQGSADGTGTSASFNKPIGIAINAAGNLYVVDQLNVKIRMITPGAAVTTLAGSSPEGFADGQGAEAKFRSPYGVTVDVSGNIYVADFGNNRIRKISPTGLVTTFAGSGATGSANGKIDVASFYGPTDVTFDASGNFYVADNYNNIIRKISRDGVVSTLAGSGVPGNANGKGTAASFYTPDALIADAAGNVYVADSGNSLIRKITPDGVVTTFAGSGKAGSADGRGTAASFTLPAGMVFDASGNLYVADYGSNKIRKVTPQGDVTTVAGNGVAGFADGPGASASFNSPYDLAIDHAGNLYVADSFNERIRKIEIGE